MSWFEVHVFGSDTKGEGIVLKLPDESYAVIDCCYRGKITTPSKNPMVSFLKSRNVTSLAFACLTHPHDDHHYGLSQILREFPPKRFIRSVAMQPDNLMRIILAEQQQSDQYVSARRSASAKELKAVYDIVRDLGRGKITRAISFRKLYPFSDSQDTVSIEAIAPNDPEIDAYERKLHECFDDDLKLKVSPLPNLQHNRISIAFLIEADSFSVVLGGDVERSNWSATINSMDPSRLKASLIKVSHHGSANGMCDGLWDLFCPDKQGIAVITGYKSKQLPREKVLGEIAAKVKEVYITHRQSISSSRTNQSDAAVLSYFNDDEVETLENGFEGVSRSRTSKYGQCSFFFDQQGSVSVSTISEATRLH